MLCAKLQTQINTHYCVIVCMQKALLHACANALFACFEHKGIPLYSTLLLLPLPSLLLLYVCSSTLYHVSFMLTACTRAKLSRTVVVCSCYCKQHMSSLSHTLALYCCTLQLLCVVDDFISSITTHCYSSNTLLITELLLRHHVILVAYTHVQLQHTVV